MRETETTHSLLCSQLDNIEQVTQVGILKSQEGDSLQGGRALEWFTHGRDGGLCVWLMAGALIQGLAVR